MSRSFNSFLGPSRRGSSTATVRVKGWVRDAFDLDPAVPLLVSELLCRKPGCPPLETSIALLEPGKGPVEFKLHKAVADITHDDIEGLAIGHRPPPTRRDEADERTKGERDEDS